MKGKGSIDTAATLGNMGLVYYNQGDYSKALQVYKQSLEIQERVKGKGSIDSAATILKMGVIYFNRGDYPKAL